MATQQSMYLQSYRLYVCPAGSAKTAPASGGVQYLGLPGLCVLSASVYCRSHLHLQCLCKAISTAISYTAQAGTQASQCFKCNVCHRC